MTSTWLRLSLDMARLGLEAQQVIALRFLRLAAGGARGRAESQRMVTEKAAAFAHAQVAAATALASGRGASAATKKAVNVYKRRVSANKRRLSRHK
jgi:hypothetical protein